MSTQFQRHWNERGGPSPWERLLMRRPVLSGLLPCLPIYAFAIYQGRQHGLDSGNFLTYGLLAVLASVLLVLASSRASSKMKKELDTWTGERDSTTS